MEPECDNAPRATAPSLSSLSIRGGAIIAVHAKKRRRIGRVRIQPSARSPQHAERDADGPTKLHSNLGVYTVDYRSALRHQNESARVPHIDEPAAAAGAGANKSKTPILIDDDDPVADCNIPYCGGSGEQNVILRCWEHWC